MFVQVPPIHSSCGLPTNLSEPGNSQSADTSVCKRTELVETWESSRITKQIDLWYHARARGCWLWSVGLLCDFRWHLLLSSFALVSMQQSQPKQPSDKSRSKKSKEPKPRIRKLKYHQYIPPDQKQEPNEAPMDSGYARLLQQQQQFLQLQILSQQQQHYSYQAILPAPLKYVSHLQIKFPTWHAALSILYRPNMNIFFTTNFV